MSMLARGVAWVRRHSVPGKGIVITSRQRACYPEVSGYFIPTLLSVGERDLALCYARWLREVQRPDGSFAGAGTDCGFAFDTGQVVRGWVALLDRYPEFEGPLRRACEWMIATADPETGRLQVPKPGGAWSLGRRGEVNEAIHLHALVPFARAGKILNEPGYENFAAKSLGYYLTQVGLTDFGQPNALTHFFAYIQEALLDLGCEDLARTGMESVARFQQENGAVPAYHDVSWVCSPGLAQLALLWFRLGQIERAAAVFDFLELLQNPSGAFFGSYGVGAAYFPAEEISWAVKYAIEASQQRISSHFDRTAERFAPTIPSEDGRVRAVLAGLGDVGSGRILDAGCGKGRYAAILKQRFPAARITALDVSAEMLRHVPEGIETVQDGILRMPFPDATFDGVLCVEALEHVVRSDVALAELVRVLRPGGRLVMIDTNREKQGVLETESWEEWFEVEETLHALQSLGVDVRAECIPYDHHREADGLFVCWAGVKVRSAA
jgi:malonyl-CoA O-methyltransferase